ncbi:MAG TPA: dTDP-4-dehydrorhamnose 3,5-epimerase [Polyangiales bacterium]
MRVTKTPLAEVLLIEPIVHGDARGFFFESWHKERYAAAGLPADFVQDNLSYSQHGILRGLHLQEPFAQGKLVSVLQGEVFDVAVDARVGSPTFGRWHGERLSAENKRQLYIAPGFAHGFCVLSDAALFSYKCTELYHAETELGVAWNDPEIGITWPLDNPVLSAKDAKAPRLREIAEARLPKYRP